MKMDRTDTTNATEARNPVTGELLGYSPLDTKEDLVQAIVKGRIAQKLWADYPIGERIKSILPIRDYLVGNADELATIIARDNGKTRFDALATEVVPSTMAITYYQKMAPKFLAERKLKSGNIILANKKSRIVRVPHGVIGIISPWNYPFTIAFSEVIMGLLAGNAVVLKTATETQWVGLALKKSIEAAHLPDGLFRFVNIPGRIAGNAMLEAGLDKLFFTGSVPVGKQLMAKAAETLTPLNLELGGNDPMIVCEDADLVRAATGAVWGGFQNAGQTCGGVQRIYVHQAVYDSFMALLKEKTEALRVGYDTNYDIDMGAMTTEAQLNVVKEHIAEALGKGAKIFAQSKVPGDPNLHNFHPALVLSEVDHTMLVMKDETFGPVLGVMKVKSIEEAIALANDSNLGLTGSVWSKDRRKAGRIARKIKAGAVTINDHVMSHGLPETSWGGIKQSGIGRTHGELGFNEMTQPQMIVDDIMPFVKKNMWWHPFNKTIYDGIKGAMLALYAKKLTDRLLGFYRMLKIFPRTFKG